MRKLYLSILATTFAAGAVFAQGGKQAPRQFNHYTAKVLQADSDSPTLLKTLGCVDTLDQYVVRAANQFTLQGAAGGGYVFGTSNDGNGASITTATAVHFDDLGMITVDEVFVWMGAKEIVGSPDLIRMEIYTTGVDSMPSTLVGFTNASMAFVDTATSGISFTTMNNLARFQIGVGSNQLTGDFAVSLNYDAINDTLAIVSTASGAGFMEGRTKQFLGPNFGAVWAKANLIWTGLDADVVFIPITTCVVSNDHSAFENKYFSVTPAYPNPSGSQVRIDVDLVNPTRMQVIMWDVTGRVLYDSGWNDASAGMHTVDLDVSDLAAGSYYYSVRTTETQVHSKLQVAH